MYMHVALCDYIVEMEFTLFCHTVVTQCCLSDPKAVCNITGANNKLYKCSLWESANTRFGLKPTQVIVYQ